MELDLSEFQNYFLKKCLKIAAKNRDPPRKPTKNFSPTTTVETCKAATPLEILQPPVYVFDTSLSMSLGFHIKDRSFLMCRGAHFYGFRLEEKFTPEITRKKGPPPPNANQ